MNAPSGDMLHDLCDGLTWPHVLPLQVAEDSRSNDHFRRDYIHQQLTRKCNIVQIRRRVQHGHDSLNTKRREIGQRNFVPRKSIGVLIILLFIFGSFGIPLGPVGDAIFFMVVEELF